MCIRDSPRRYWAAEADRPEFAEYIASFAGNGGAGLYIHGGVGAGKTVSYTHLLPLRPQAREVRPQLRRARLVPDQLLRREGQMCIRDSSRRGRLSYFVLDFGFAE